MKCIFCLLIIMLTVALAPRKGVGQWVQTNGPYGASVLSITNFGNDIFIGTVDGIFESTDQGSNWQNKSKGLPDGLYYSTLTTRGTNIFAATYSTAYGSTVYCSTDSGGTWSLASAGLASIYILSLGSSKQSVFLLCGPYSYVSSNDGNEWKLLDTNLTKFSNPQCALTVDSVTYVAGAWITQTTNDGLNWAVNALPQADTFWDITCLANLGDYIFAIDRASGILLSTNSGTTWEKTIYLPQFKLAIYLAILGTEIFAGADDGSVYRSNDSGSTWELAASGLPLGGALSGLSSIGTDLLAAYNGPGMYRSLDSGKTWSVCGLGLVNPAVNVIANTGDTILSGTTGGLFLSTDNGSSWQTREHEMANYNIQSILVDGGNLFVGTEGGWNNTSLFISTDRGEDWKAETIDGYNFAALIRTGPNLIAGGTPYAFGGLYSSNDNGLIWKDCNVDFDYPAIAVNGIIKIGSMLVASTNDGPGISTDDGLNWQQSDAVIDYYERIEVSAIGSTNSELFIDCIPYNGPGNLGVFVSDDFGNSWHHALDTLFPSRGEVRCFASVGNNLFASTDSDGIFLTTDSGAHWTSENLGLGDSNVISLAVQGNELLAGTASSGVWRRPLAEMIPPSSVASEKSPKETISVYPDPASSLVTISCPDMKGTIDARLISITGVTVCRKTLEADGRPFQLDFADVANGTYSLELKSDESQEAAKIVIKR